MEEVVYDDREEAVQVLDTPWKVKGEDRHDREAFRLDGKR